MTRASAIKLGSIVTFLERLGHELRAGGDNPAGYIASQLGCKSEEGKKTVQGLLCSDQDEIYVDFDPDRPGRIVAVGLTQWRTTSSAAVDESPADNTSPSDNSRLISENQRLVTEITQLRAQIADRDSEIAALHGDLDAAEVLLGKETSSAEPPATVAVEALESQVAALIAERDSAQKQARNARDARDNVAKEWRRAKRDYEERIQELEDTIRQLTDMLEGSTLGASLIDQLAAAIGSGRVTVATIK